jgi:hypothetical protein
MIFVFILTRRVQKHTQILLHIKLLVIKFCVKIQIFIENDEWKNQVNLVIRNNSLKLIYYYLLHDLWA